MKKIVLRILCVAMLTAMVSAYSCGVAAAEDELNLIKNGSFENNSGVDALTFNSWEQTGSASYMVKPRVREFLLPADDGGKYLAYGKKGAVLRQTVRFDNNAEYVKDQDNYKFIFSATAYAAGSEIQGSVKLTVYDKYGNKREKDKDFSGDRVADIWTMNSVTVDFSETVDILGETAVKAELELIAGTEVAWDDIRLTPVYAPDRIRTYRLNIINGDFEDDRLGTGGYNITGWTADSDAGGWYVKGTNNHDVIPDGNKLLFAEGESRGGGALRQTVALDSNADYYKNMQNYIWTLSVRAYYILKIDITVYNEDKSQSATTNFTTYPNRQWVTYNMFFDITEAMGKVENAKYVEIALMAHTVGHTSGVDSVTIKATSLRSEQQVLTEALTLFKVYSAAEDGRKIVLPVIVR